MVAPLIAKSLLFVGLATLGDASAFLRSGGAQAGLAERMSAEVIRRSLLSELTGHAAGARVAKMEAALRPMYAALPKGPHGHLDSAAVRYALHRYFVQQHGWYIRGLDPAGGMWNATSPAGITKDRVPSYLQGLFEERLGGHGFALEDLAIFAATLEDLVHQEASEHLEVAYQVLGYPMFGDLAVEATDSALRAYMMVFILGMNVSGMSSSDLLREHREMHQIYPNWDETLTWALDMRLNLAYRQRHQRNPFVPQRSSFTSTLEVVREVGEHFGAFQNLECRSLKDALVELEHRGTGRVLLTDFYRGGMGGHWQFTESIAYLRSLGALDESDPSAPAVMIPNYIASPSNCLASSNLYSVCCLDECEGLLSQLERRIASASAPPEQIADLVSRMASDTVDAPRNLSAPLRSRLGEIAARHGGQVPLHSRLFAQWMHHAYPRECPYPHLAGTTNPLTPDQWMAETGQGDIVASKEDMQRHVDTYMAPEAKADALPWTDVEELVVAHGLVPQKPAWGSWRAALRSAMLLAAFASVAVHLFRSSRALCSVVGDLKSERHLV